MLLWSLQSPELQEHRVMHFSFFLGFSSTWLPMKATVLCEGTDSSSPFSSTRSQLTEPTHLPFLWVCPLTFSPAVKSLPFLPARASVAVMQPLCAAETSNLSWRPFSKKHQKTKGKKKNYSKHQFSGNTNAMTWCVNKFNLTIKINLWMTSAKAGYEDKPLWTFPLNTLLLWLLINTKQTPLTSTHKPLKNEMD